MSRKKLLGIGLLSALSLFSTGCSEKKEIHESEKAPTLQKAKNLRRQGKREDISLSYIAPQKDYVKSINCLLSLYDEVIPIVEKKAPRMGISKALNEAYAQCRVENLLKGNSKAYSFTDIIQKNYVLNNFAQWKKSFSEAGKEAKLILSEGDAVSRKFVPRSITNPSFLRRDIFETDSIRWQTAEDFEKENYIRQGMKNCSSIKR